MKWYSLIIIVLVLLTGACSEDFLTEHPHGKDVVDNYFANSTELEAAVTGCYFWVNSMFGQADKLQIFLGSDDVAPNPGQPKFRDFDIFEATSATEANGNLWKSAYALVHAANNVILNYERVPGMTDEARNRAGGEAYFMRALAYFYLVRIYNEIPLVLDLVVDTKREKATPDAVYAQIVDDLLKAEMYLPADRTKFPEYKQHAAPGKGAAQTLLASVYLTMAGYPLNMGTGHFALAAQKAKEVIDNHQTYGYELMENFADLWKQKNDPPAGNNPEVVFGAFYNNNLVIWSPDGFAYGNMCAPMPCLPKEADGWADYSAEINFFNSFPAGPRKDATFLTTFRMMNGDVIEWQDGIAKHPFYKKYADAGSFDENAVDKYQDWWSSRAMIIIRYAEVLLCYAEAKAMSDGPDATAYAAINEVRARAGLPALTQGLSQTAFRDSVLAERGWEFAGMEPTGRWFDLVRTERVEQAAANRHPNEAPIAPGKPNKENYFCPIPISEKLINPNL